MQIRERVKGDPKLNFFYKYFIVSAVLFWGCFLFSGKADAATYYVKNGGNDSATGTSDATAWATIGKVNQTAFQRGDDAYFKCGSTWSGTYLSPNLQGVDESNYSVIGAYYGSGTIGVSGAKPIIDGNNNTVPAKGSYMGLINLANKSYMTVQDMQVQWSGERGITCNTGSFIKVLRCDTLHSYSGGIALAKAPHSLVEHCYDFDNSRVRIDTKGYAAGIAFSGGSDYSVARYNKIVDSRGEGIDTINGAIGSTIEYNTVIGSDSCGIYADLSKDNTIRYNLIYGYPGGYRVLAGLCINDEERPAWNITAISQNNKFYGNVVAYADQGIGIASKKADSVVKDTEIYNNTFVDNLVGIQTYGDTGPYENSFIKNNIFWITSQRTGCTQANLPASHPGLTLDYNLWSSEPQAAAKGSHDPVYVAPFLEKASGWNSLVSGSLSTGDFKLRSGSPAINKGSTLVSPAGQTYNIDYLGVVRPQGVGWDIGAHEYATGDTTAPGSPSGLSVR